MLSLSEDNQPDVIEAVNSSSRYLDDLLNNDNDFFESMINCIYYLPFRNSVKPGQRVRYRGLIFGFIFMYIRWFC